jgi:hypothetical protein
MKKRKNRDVESKLTVLSAIRQVDVSPFLFSRIEAKLDALNERRIVPTKIVFSLAVAAILLLIFNTLAIRLELKSMESREISSLTIFTEQNDLYYE